MAPLCNSIEPKELMMTEIDDGMNNHEAKVSDLLTLGAAIIRRHDKGVMTDSTIRKHVDGVTITYNLSKEVSEELEAELKKLQ